MGYPNVLEKFNTYLPLSGGTVTGVLNKVGGYCNLSITSDGNSGYTDLSFFGTDNIRKCLFRLWDDDSSLNIGLTDEIDGSAVYYKSLSLTHDDDGSYFKWDGKNVETVYSSGTNYIRYTNGLQICWGHIDYSLSGTNITFPATFISTPCVCCGALYTGIGTPSAKAVYTSYFTYEAKNSAVSANYIAIGLWK